jgi:ribose/xylose/arabinose/galactoside ABC-type transport system permease subunit
MSTTKQSKFQKFLGSKHFQLLILFLFEIIVFTILASVQKKSFLSLNVLTTILDGMTVVGFLVVGAAFLMIAGNIDLSAASIGTLGGMFLAAMIAYYHLPWWLAILMTLVLCGAFGLFNAVLVNEFKFQPFIATMAMSSVATGLTYLASMNLTLAEPKRSTINIVDKVLYFIGRFQFSIIGSNKESIYNNLSENVRSLSVTKSLFYSETLKFDIPFNIIFLVVAFVIFAILLSKTKFGMKVYLVGGNPWAARLAGVNPKKYSYILFVNSAVMAGIAGIITTAKTSQGSTTSAVSMLMFSGMTAAMLGGISFGGGSGGMGGAFLGLMITQTFSQGMKTINANNYWATVFNGVLLILALAIDFMSQRRAIKGAIK